MGLVTVALLTLAPLALRPVRLACLIHAANVHSEPGSNPSRLVEATMNASRRRPHRHRVPPHFRVEDLLTWSQRAVSLGRSPDSHSLPVGEPIPPSSAPNRGTGRRRRPTPASLKGPQLTTEPRSTELSKNLPTRVPTDATGRSDLALWACHAGRRDRSELVAPGSVRLSITKPAGRFLPPQWGDKENDNTDPADVKPSVKFFCRSAGACVQATIQEGAGQLLDGAGKCPLPWFAITLVDTFHGDTS